MLKTILILIAGVAAALIIGGVIEISWHPDRLAQVPNNLVKAVASQEQLKNLGMAAQNLLIRVVAVGLPKVAGTKDEPEESPDEPAEESPEPSPEAPVVETIPLKF